MKRSLSQKKDGNSGQIESRSYNTSSSLLAEPSRGGELVGRYAGMSRADLSPACIALFSSKYQKTPTCWLWTAGKYARFGYGMVFIGRHEDGRQINSYAHRVAYVLAKGDIPAGLVVRHTCDTPACVNPDHLVLGTQGDNNRDTVKKRRHCKTRPWLRKLSDADVLFIRESPELGSRLAERFGVSKSCISQLRNGIRRKVAA